MILAELPGTKTLGFALYIPNQNPEARGRTICPRFDISGLSVGF